VTYTLSRKAEDDLIEIYIEGVSLFGEYQADQYHRKIESDGAWLGLLSCWRNGGETCFTHLRFKVVYL